MWKHLSRAFMTATTGAVVLLMAACGSSTAAGSPSSLKIVVVPKTLGSSYWDVVQQGAQCAASKYQNVTIVWDGTTAETDVSGQVSLLQNYITQKPSGIIYAATDAKSLTLVNTQAKAQGIPIENIDSGTDPQDIPLFATNNSNSASKAADLLGQALNGAGNIAIVEFVPGSATNDQRVNGFKTELAAKYPNIKIVAQQADDSDNNKALNVTQDILSKHPDLNGIFAANDQSATGAAQAVKNAGKGGVVKIVGWDASAPEQADVKDGSISALVLQNPFKMGYESVKSLVHQLRDGVASATEDTGVTFVTPDNLTSTQITAALTPTCANQSS